MPNDNVYDDQIRMPVGYDPVEAEPLRILSLSGGGYRGLFSASLLAHIEDMPEYQGAPIGARFNLFAGTSIGGIIAAGLATGVSANTIRALLVDRGKAIFPKIRFKKIRQALFKTVYDTEPLEEAIRSCFGKKICKTPLSDIEVPLLLTSVSWTMGKLILLKSGGLDPATASKITLLDALLATSAAPTYFQSKQYEGDFLVDGGLAANCPDYLAWLEANLRSNDIRMLGIGTSGFSLEDLPSKKPFRGIFWAEPALALSMKAQEHQARSACEAEMGDRYLYLNRLAGQNQRDLEHLDCASDDATTGLTLAAETLFKELSDDEILRLNHILSPVVLR